MRDHTQTDLLINRLRAANHGRRFGAPHLDDPGLLARLISSDIVGDGGETEPKRTASHH
jgi:hypothetical protein